MPEFLNRRCPIGSRSIDWAIRHCTDFSGITGKIIIPDSLTQFREFRYNENKKRISFLTANASGCQGANPYNVFSMDKYQIDQWNHIFIQANPDLKYHTPDNPGGIRFYDFADRDADDKNGYTTISKLAEDIRDLPEFIKDTGKTIFLLSGIGFTIYLLNKTNKK